MSNMTIEVEFLAGTSLEDAIDEAREKAIRFDVAYIVFSFNGKRISVGKNADLVRAISEFDEKGGLNSKYGYVFN